MKKFTPVCPVVREVTFSSKDFFPGVHYQISKPFVSFNHGRRYFVLGESFIYCV